MADLIDLPLRRASHRPLLRRCWQLRHNLTSYDACYVALAETLDVPLLAADIAQADGVIGGAPVGRINERRALCCNGFTGSNA